MAFLGVGQVIGADGAVVKVDAVEGLGERFEGLLAAGGLELTFPLRLFGVAPLCRVVCCDGSYFPRSQCWSCVFRGSE